MSFNRTRVGRQVLYTPTAADATAYGPGPWPATITAVNDGTVSLSCLLPSQEATVDATDLATAQALANALKARDVAAHPPAAIEGSGGNTFSFNGVL